MRVADVDLATIGRQYVEQMRVDIVDPVADYQALMATLFDFDKIRNLFQSGFHLRGLLMIILPNEEPSPDLWQMLLC